MTDFLLMIVSLGRLRIAIRDSQCRYKIPSKAIFPSNTDTLSLTGARFLPKYSQEGENNKLSHSTSNSTTFGGKKQKISSRHLGAAIWATS
jgi:hypothetical protein